MASKSVSLSKVKKKRAATTQPTSGGAASISVIIPIYNVSPYLQECLESIARQTHRAFEAIMVDDGSTDGSGDIAENFAAHDDRFRLVRQANAGPGAARNKALELATGEFIAFVDADDLLLDRAFEIHVASLTSTSADFSTGNVQRLKGGRVYPSGHFAKAIKEDKTETDLLQSPELIWDTVFWNKLFRADFFRKSVKSFEEGMLYEDMPPIYRAYARASKVNVISDFVYIWRIREDSTSTTQNKSEVTNLRDRMRATIEIFHFLKSEAPYIIDEYKLKQLHNDLLLFAVHAGEGSSEYKAAICEAVQELHREFGGDAFRNLPVAERVLYHLLRRGRVDQVAPLIPYTRGVKQYPIVLQGSTYLAKLPVEYTKDIIPILDVSGELKAHAFVTGMTQNSLGILIRGCAYVDRLSVAQQSDTELRINLIERKTKAIITAEPVRLGDSSEISGAKSKEAPKWSGFEAQISYFEIARRTKEFGRWDVSVTLWIGRRERKFTVPLNVDLAWPDLMGRQFDQRWLRVTKTRADDLCVVVEDLPYVVQSASVRDEFLEIVVNTYGLTKPETLVLKDEGGLEVRAPLTGDDQLKGLVPVKDIQNVFRTDSSTVKFAEVYVSGPGEKLVRIRAARDFVSRDYGAEFGLLVSPRMTARGNLIIFLESRPIEIESLELVAGNLVLLGKVHSTSNRLRIEAVHNESNARYPIRVFRQGGLFSAALDFMKVPRAPKLVSPMQLGRYSLEFLIAGEPARAFISGPQISASTSHKGIDFKVNAVESKIDIALANAFRADERGPEAQEKLREKLYYKPIVDKARKPLIVFESWAGKKIDCHPVALYRKLVETSGKLDLLFVVADATVPIPQGIPAVRKWTREYWEALGRAAVVIVNDSLPASFRKRPGQYVIQTWHGTPLKRIGFDVDNPVFDPNYRSNITRLVNNWDCLISPNWYSTDRFRTAFDYKGTIWEVGSPRNDLLIGPLAEERRRVVRSYLKLPNSALVGLYLPTWRDEQKLAPGKYAFNQAPDFTPLFASNPDLWMMTRNHHLTVGRIADGESRRLLDLSQYPEVADLYLAADFLVTDFSSAMVDFSITGKPMFMYAPDLSDYMNVTRGFYVDLVDEFPGEVASTVEELATHLSGVSPSASIQHEKMAAWQKKYHHLEDGEAADRAVARILGLGLL